ncbi:response regulator transcription factor [Oscillatoria salina]|uniref:response regulator transcription factor n=1 Tax=Oscillatoria salina TaxID=331517 RepID=UPI001CCFE3FA|nr:response regulator [Oscillatoria salina]MBZ8179756.1 response regulator [Oscillatoria salina IIICB1]
MTKFLVIEDAREVRLNLQEILESKDFEVIDAENGEQGIKRAQEELPDLIICDIMLPGLDGYDVLGELRKEPITSTIPFIFLTAKVDRDDQRLGMELGADDYITKPCTPTELLSAIATRMKKHTAYMESYDLEKKRAQALQKRVQELEKLSNSQEELLNKLCEELRNPTSNINLAIKMLNVANSEETRQRYLRVLQQECSREIAIINQFSQLLKILTPENAQLLSLLNSLNKSNQD